MVLRMGGRFHEKPIYMGDFLKRGLEQFADVRGAWQERGGWCFWRGGGLIPQCTLCLLANFTRIIDKILPTVNKENNNRKQNLYWFIRNLRVTPHLPTGNIPAELIFHNFLFRNRIPCLIVCTVMYPFIAMDPAEPTK